MGFKGDCVHAGKIYRLGRIQSVNMRINTSKVSLNMELSLFRISRVRSILSERHCQGYFDCNRDKSDFCGPKNS